METKTHSRAGLIVGTVVFALLTSGCTLLLPRTGGGGSTPCHEGTWELSGQQISDAITSVFGDLTVTPDNDGMTLELRADGTFSFSGQQTLAVSGTTPFGSVDGVVDADATVAGTFTAAPDSLTFSLGSITGTGSFDGTVNGAAFSGSLSHAQSGLDDVYGLSGTAAMTCSPALLTLDFGDIDWEF